MAAVEKLIARGEKVGVSTLAGTMAPRFKAALEMGGCSAMSLLLAVVDGVDEKVRRERFAFLSDYL